MAAQTEILTAVTESLSAFVDHGDWQEAFGRLLRAALSLTYSEYGFVGVVVDGPVLRVLAHEGIVWDQVVNREFYEQALRDYWHHGYLTFDNFNNLFGRAVTTGQVVIANTPDADPRAGGRPAGHPPMSSFMGVPIRARDQVTGLIALANRSDGYGDEERLRIETLVRQVGGMCEAYRHRERARVETEERRKAEEALRQSDERLRLVARATNDAVWDWNLETNAVFMPEGFQKIFGGAGEPSEMAITDWYHRIDPRDLDRVMAGLHAALDSGAQFWSGEYRFARGDGIYATVFDRGYILHDTAGRPVRMIGAMMDISDRKQLEAQFRQSQKLEAVGQLAGGVAHDFNNILTVIQAHASLLLDHGLPDPVHTSLRQISDAAERAAGLTRQLLAFSRKQVLQTIDLDLNEAVSRMMRLLERILGEDIALAVDLSPSRAMVHADASMIEQVILNLAVNARDAMPRGGSLTLRTTIERIGPEAVTDGVDARAGMFVRLAMRDTGCGISPEHLPHIFEPFFTTKHVDRGTGLGLATVYGIVQQHEGWVDVNSCVGAGTTFDVYFPLHAGAAPTPVISPAGGADVIGHETILIVEDDEPVRRIARMLLERRGYRVLEAESGPAALAHCGEHRGTLDLVVTDMVLPGGLSGLELAAQLRTIWPNLDTILTSGYSVDLAGKEFRPPEHVHFLPKPYSATHLLNAVRATLDLRGSRIPEST